MEQRQKEWTSAALAAERGLEILKSAGRLAYMAGLSRSQSAKDLYQAQYSRAEQEAQKAEIHLKTTLTDIDVEEQSEYRFRSKIHRALTLNYELLVRISQWQQDTVGERRFLGLLNRSLDGWLSEHPHDPDAASERQRLLYWFPSLRRISPVSK